MQLELKNKELIDLPLPVDQCIDIAYKTMEGKIVGASDIIPYLELQYNVTITMQQAIAIIIHPTFAMLVHNLSMANARHSFDAVAFNQLISIAQHSPDEKNKISAIKTLGDLTGLNASKGNRKTEININLDSMIRKNDESPFPGF